VLEGTVSHLLILKQIGEQEGYRRSLDEPDSHRPLEFKAHVETGLLSKIVGGKVSAKKRDKVGGGAAKAEDWMREFEMADQRREDQLQQTSRN
jgi:hypothetical protein